MAKRKKQPLQQLSLFDEVTLKDLERSKPKKVEQPGSIPKQKVQPRIQADAVVQTVHTVWGAVSVTADTDFIIQECGYSSLEAFLCGEEPRPPRPPTKRKKRNHDA